MTVPDSERQDRSQIRLCMSRDDSEGEVTQDDLRRGEGYINPQDATGDSNFDLLLNYLVIVLRRLSNPLSLSLTHSQTLI
jgi:hypothetical protein